MGTNPFINIGDDLLAEAWNGAIIMFASCNPQITISLPSDLDGENFVIGAVDDQGNLQYVKAGFLLTFLTLVNCQISNGTIQLATGQTTGTATFRVYPNIMPLLNWLSLGWVAGTGGTVTCTINKVSDGSVVLANINNPQNLTSEDMDLEFYDIVFTLTQEAGVNPILNSIQIALQGGV